MHDYASRWSQCERQGKKCKWHLRQKPVRKTMPSKTQHLGIKLPIQVPSQENINDVNYQL
jgi:hypothetical protein